VVFVFQLDFPIGFLAFQTVINMEIDKIIPNELYC